MWLEGMWPGLPPLLQALWLTDGLLPLLALAYLYLQVGTVTGLCARQCWLPQRRKAVHVALEHTATACAQLYVR